MSESATKQRLQALVADKRYWKFNHPEHDAYVAYVTGEFRRAYPSSGKSEGANSRLAANEGGGSGGSVHVQSYTRTQGGQQVAVNDYYRSVPGSGGGHRMPSHLKPTTAPIRPTDYYRDLGFDPNGPGEWEMLRNHPVDTLRARLIADEARNEAIRQYENNDISLTIGEGDAYRHGLWSYKMAKELGPDKAKDYGDAHEISSPNNDGDRLKDVYNNAVGRELALDPSNHGKSDSEVIKQAIRQGKFQIDPFNVPGPIEPLWRR